MATESFVTNIIFYHNHTDVLVKVLENNQKPNLTEVSAKTLSGEEVSNFVRQLKESRK